MTGMERDIDYVIAVAECRSISKAAELLYISQPSLSRYLSSLESELGINLFVRTINGTELTEAGRIYVEYAKEIRRLRSTMKIQLRELVKAEAGRIRVGMTLNAISLSPFNVAEEVKRRYPDSNAELFNLLSKDIPEMLRNRSYDLVIGPDLDWGPEFKLEVLYRDPYVLVVPDRYDLEAYAVFRPDLPFPFLDLRKIPRVDFILQENTTAVRKGIDRICRMLDIQIRPKLLVSSTIIALQAAENQVGCCIVTLGQLAFLSHWEKLRFYQVSDQIYSSAAAIYLRGKRLLEEEQYCISCIGRALTNGEAEILRRLRGTHDGTGV